MGKSVAFAVLPDSGSRMGGRKASALGGVGSPMLDPNEPAPPPALEGDALQPDWRSRLMTTPSLPQVLERIKREREKSGYEEAFLREREVKEKEKARRRERERRRRRGHHRRYRDQEEGVRHRGRSRASGVDTASDREKEEAIESQPPSRSTSDEAISRLEERPTPGLPTSRNPISRASSWTHSLLGHAVERRSAVGRKRRAIIDLSTEQDTPVASPQPSPSVIGFPPVIIPPPTEPRRNKPARSRSRLVQIKSDLGLEGDAAGDPASARRTSSLTDVVGLGKAGITNADETSNTSSTSSDATKADIVRPKSASDLLGMNRDPVPRSHSSSQLHTHSHRSKPPLFVLPPVPRPALLRGQTGVSTAHRAPPLLRTIETSEADIEIERKLGKEGCWWLDVSCPSWEDLRDLGELLHLHPLTLEDVLQQDPREKLDVFENLGYYLIVFRAIDETYFKYTAPDAGASLMKPGGFLPTSKRNAKVSTSSKSGRKKGKLEIVEDNPGKEGLEGVTVGGINIYLVVFADGIVSVSVESIPV